MAKSHPIRKGARGERIDDLQKGIDAVLGSRKFPWRKVPVDGVAGDATFNAANLALFLIGASSEQLRVINSGRITQRSFDLLTKEVERTKAMKKRDLERRVDAKKLRAEHKLSQQIDADGFARYVAPSGREWKVAAWMVGAKVGPDGRRVNWLKKSQKHGWSGELYSGARTPAYSRSLCEAMCGAPSCPGKCAGESSEHSQAGPPDPGWGAIDAQDYERFGSIQREIGSPLRNDLPSDRPHYSTTGH